MNKHNKCRTMKGNFSIKCLIALCGCYGFYQTASAQDASLIKTMGDMSALLQHESGLAFVSGDGDFSRKIHIDENKAFQQLDGLGYALTQGSAQEINQLDNVSQAALLNELFHPESGKGISMLRISIGASDLSTSLYSYSEETTNTGGFTPDPAKKYYIDMPAHDVRLGTNGYHDSPYTAENQPTGDDYEWRFIASGDGFWFLERAAGGYLPRLRTDDTNMADMDPSSSNGTWEKWALTPGEGEDNYFISLPLKGLGNHDRLQVDNNALVRMVDNDQSAGTWESFHFTEVGNTTSFSLAGPDSVDLIPLLKKILVINPEIKIIATPWTAPRRMKTNNDWVGGRLKTDSYAEYAQYFVQYINAMATHGINIWAISPQNEPENGFNEPSMLMNADEQFNFVDLHLGPALQSGGHQQVKIIGFDHNCDNLSFPIQVAQSQYVDGSAFHLYAGDISAMTTVKEATGKNVYFTEQWTQIPSSSHPADVIEAFNQDFGWHMENVVIGSIRNWSKTVFEWNLATSASAGEGGCVDCMGAIDVLGNNQIIRNVSYYIISQLSEVLTPGAVRIDSGALQGDVSHVAFKNPDDSLVLLAYNGNSHTSENVSIVWQDQALDYSIAPRTAVSFVWSPTSTPDKPGLNCQQVNVYPNWMRKDWHGGDPTHNATDDKMVFDGMLYRANWYSNSVPGSDASWTYIGACAN